MKTTASAAGKVYLLRGKVTGLYKIGRSRDPEVRVRRLSYVLSEPVELIHTITTDDANVLERLLHTTFAAQRIHHEWFRLRRRQVNAIKRERWLPVSLA